jgi:hypothetical protein
MFNLFKFKISKSNTQESTTTLESWTVVWSVRGGVFGETDKYHKVFVNIGDAQDFRAQLVKSAKFINVWISTAIEKN